MKNDPPKTKDNPKLKKYKKDIKIYKETIWKPPLNQVYQKLDLSEKGTCFNIEKSERTDNKKYDSKIKFKNEFKKTVKKCFRVNAYPTKKQILILKDWFRSSIKMYNMTLNYLKRTYHKRYIWRYTPAKPPPFPSFYELRKIMKPERDKIIEKSTFLKIKGKILDQTIKQVLTAYKSGFTNLKNGNIKFFRLRYQKFDRRYKELNIDPQYFNGHSLCGQALGIINSQRDGVDFCLEDIRTIYQCQAKLIYDSEQETFVFIIPEDITTEKISDRKDMISLDPGIRTFMMGISDSEAIKIGDGFSEKIKKRLEYIDRKNKDEKLSKTVKKKIEKTQNRKISNMVDELHWKAINFLTKNYDKILIGDMKTKGIVSNNKKTNLDPMTKRKAYKLKFFSWHQRLKYKCESRHVHLEVVDESYTSIICSNCGTYHENLGSSKEFSCPAKDCNFTIDRDLNGARGIYIKARGFRN